LNENICPPLGIDYIQKTTKDTSRYLKLEYLEKINILENSVYIYLSVY